MTLEQIGGNSAQALLSFVERIERLSEEIEGLGEDRKEVYAEAKSSGFDTATLRKAIRLRSIPKDKREEAEAILALYMETLDKAERSAQRQSEEDGQ